MCEDISFYSKFEPYTSVLDTSSKGDIFSQLLKWSYVQNCRIGGFTATNQAELRRLCNGHIFNWAWGKNCPARLRSTVQCLVIRGGHCGHSAGRLLRPFEPTDLFKGVQKVRLWSETSPWHWAVLRMLELRSSSINNFLTLELPVHAPCRTGRESLNSYPFYRNLNVFATLWAA